MKKGIPFVPYQGAEDYVFVSYAHKDSAAVFDVIGRLHREKYRVWYDQGIEIGADWPQVVAEKLQRSALVLIFVSENALKSQNCRREIHYAVSQKKEMLVVFLDDCALPADMAMQLSVVPQLRFGNGAQTAEEVISRLSGSLIGDGVTGYEDTGAGGRSGVNRWLIVAVVTSVLLLCAVVYLALGLSGRLSRAGIVKETVPVADASGSGASGEVSVTQFRDALSMEILLRSLNSPYVHICGNCIVSDASAIVRTGGGWEIGGEAVERGPVSKLDYFTGSEISQLSLVNENLRSLEGIETMTSLTWLDLSDNPITDLAPLASLTQLQTLRLTDLPPETDLSPLAGLANLRAVYVSYDMKNAIAPLIGAGIDVTVRGEK